MPDDLATRCGFRQDDVHQVGRSIRSWWQERSAAHLQAHAAAVLEGPGLQDPAHQDDAVDMMVGHKKLLGKEIMNHELLISKLLVFRVKYVKVLCSFLEKSAPMEVNHLLRAVLFEIVVYWEGEIELMW